MAYEQRHRDDSRTLGTLFYACSEELQDLNLIEALQRIIALALDKIRAVGIATDDVIHAILDTVMATAIDILKNSQALYKYNSLKSNS